MMHHTAQPTAAGTIPRQPPDLGSGMQPLYMHRKVALSQLHVTWGLKIHEDLQVFGD